MAAHSHSDGSRPSADNHYLDEPLSLEQAYGVLRQRLQEYSPAWALSRADMRHLARRLYCRNFAPGQVILPRRVRADCLGLVVSGQVAAWQTSPVSGPPDHVLTPGSIFGRSMLLAGRPSSATLQALTAAEVWILRRADLEAALHERRARQRRTALARAAPWLAVCLLGALLAALPPIRQAAALGPMAVGQWCWQQEQSGCAERAWSLAASLAPSDASALLALGTLYFKQGDTAAAEREFEAALALNPDAPEAYNNLGLLYASQGAYDRAIIAFEEALALEPGSPTVEHNLAFSLQATGANEQALEHYRLAVALGDQAASTQANMAIAYLETGLLSPAADAARQALALDEGLAPAHAVLGAVALTTGDPAGAVPSLQRAIDLDPVYSPAHFYLALAYQALGRPAEAKAAFERALATAPDEAMRVRIRRHLSDLTTPSN